MEFRRVLFRSARQPGRLSSTDLAWMPLARKFASRHRRAQCGLGVRRRRVDTPRAPTGPAREADMDLQVTGKRVVVRGGSQGIGLAGAAGFLDEGALVSLVDRDAEGMDEAGKNP